MKVLVTGAKGFVGQNLCTALAAIRDGKDQRPGLKPLLPLEVYECDRGTARQQLEEWCGQCGFVFHLAGVNRPDDPAEFQQVNRGFTEELLQLLEAQGNSCPVMLASSVQASLEGRYEGSEYGKSKLAAEELLREHGKRTGARVLIYRFPHIFGKWCKPDYNSVVATFCHNAAQGLPLRVDDPATQLDLLYIDDLVEGMLQALLGQENRGGGQDEPDGQDLPDGFCQVLPTHQVTLGQLAELLEGFHAARGGLDAPLLPAGSLEKKLYSTYLSYLDLLDAWYPLSPQADQRGSFTEVLRLAGQGQVSMAITKPGQTRGQHWHHSKWEKFCVVAGEGLIRMRRVGLDGQGQPYPTMEYQVSGDEPVVVETLPGHAHSITNLSDIADLVTLIWANEPFDPEHPDTFAEEV